MVSHARNGERLPIGPELLYRLNGASGRQSKIFLFWTSGHSPKGHFPFSFAAQVLEELAV